MRNKKQNPKVAQLYHEVLELVEEGMTISKAIKKMGMHGKTFYDNITDLQKQEIYAAKKLHTQFGVGSRMKFERNY